ncbi:hypothetical protein [Caballeronia sp. LZ035]|uniref:hypothetical protein n=1 Tax=Caballeronia sp. LZ035 TaxID=3038568 RepID=UPI0028630266|nr:hypothetical protein [Caballeronia sp. LZ035]MDR5758494.1 hypothetical protein [Caballeronia sp. LZ035]
MQSDVLKMAQESGMTVLLEGRIGNREYTSVSGSAEALQRFVHDVRASLQERPRPQGRRPRAARPPGTISLVTARMRERIAATQYRGALATRRHAFRRRAASIRCSAHDAR